MPDFPAPLVEPGCVTVAQYATMLWPCAAAAAASCLCAADFGLMTRSEPLRSTFWHSPNSTADVAGGVAAWLGAEAPGWDGLVFGEVGTPAVDGGAWVVEGWSGCLRRGAAERFRPRLVGHRWSADGAVRQTLKTRRQVAGVRRRGAGAGHEDGDDGTRRDDAPAAGRHQAQLGGAGRVSGQGRAEGGQRSGLTGDGAHRLRVDQRLEQSIQLLDEGARRRRPACGRGSPRPAARSAVHPQRAPSHLPERS